MKRKTIFIGLVALTILLLVRVAAGSIGEDAGEYVNEKRGEMERFFEMEEGAPEGEKPLCGPGGGKGDLDNDSIPDCEDMDDDGDGINDTDDEFPHDHDNDGIPDHRDDDDDNDGILDEDDEYYVGNTPEKGKPKPKWMREMMKHRIKMFMNGDLDNDSIANCEDPDDDGDGINDTDDEFPHDHDNDGIPDFRDDDDDNDGIPDSEDDSYVGNTPDKEERKEKREEFREKREKIKELSGRKGGKGGRRGRGGEGEE